VKIDLRSIGQRIRNERENLALSREEFAEIIGLSDYYVGQLERGERQMSLTALVNIANCLHTSLDFLIFGKDSGDVCYVHENSGVYNTLYLEELTEIHTLLNKCTPKELELFRKLIKTVLPYI